MHESGEEMQHSLKILSPVFLSHYGSGKLCLPVYHSRKFWRKAKISIIHKADAKEPHHSVIIRYSISVYHNTRQSGKTMPASSP